MGRRIRMVAAAALLAGITLVGFAFELRALDWPSGQSRMIGGRHMLEASGRVMSLDVDAVVLAPTLLRVNTRRFVLDEETRILVGDKEGGIGDLRSGGNVEVIYEARPQGYVARWLGVNIDREALRRAALGLEKTSDAAEIAPSVGGAAGAKTASGVSSAAAAETAPSLASAAAEETVPSGGSAGPTETAPSLRSAAAEPPALKTVPHQADTQKARRRAQLKTRPTAPASPASEPRSSGRDGEDPGAVIDWLLRNAGRR